jgi:hypothetical protein
VKRRDLERHLTAHGCRAVGGTKHAKWRGPINEVSALPRHKEPRPGAGDLRLPFGIPSPSVPCGNEDGRRDLKLSTQTEIVS